MDYRYPRKRQRSREEQERPPQDREQTLRRAKLKALRLLERMDRTEAQLREKLLGAEFDETIVEAAVEYVKSFGYIDDERYVRNYIECRRDKKSRRRLEQELQYKKGVPPELIRRVYEEMDPADEKDMIRKLLAKKSYDLSGYDDRQRQRVIASLSRKGFHMGDILEVLREVELRDS